MIIDISCDRAGAIETSIPTTIEEPTYLVDGVRHYVVDHTPSLFYKSTTESLSHELPVYLNELISGDINLLKASLIVKGGIIINQRINEFQGR